MPIGGASFAFEPLIVPFLTLLTSFEPFEQCHVLATQHRSAYDMLEKI